MQLHTVHLFHSFTFQSCCHSQRAIFSSKKRHLLFLSICSLKPYFNVGCSLISPLFVIIMLPLCATDHKVKQVEIITWCVMNLPFCWVWLRGARCKCSREPACVTVASVVHNYLLPFSLSQEDDEGPLCAPEYDTISENGLLSRNEPIRAKVSKLTEKLRKRYPTTSTGQCALSHPPV